MRDAATVYLPQASTLPQFVTVHQPPSAINLKPYSWHRHWMLRQPRETLSSKQGVPNQTRHAIREKKQGATMSRQQANGTSLTSVSSTKPQIQRKRCHLARRHYLSACHSLCDDNPTATLPAACLAQFVTMHQPPISHQLETILLASSLDAQTAKGNFVIKAGRPQPNSTCHQGKKNKAPRCLVSKRMELL